MALSRSKSSDLRRASEKLAASYPDLLAEAERVAAVVAQGVHGRRRPGQGETFWQYRNYNSSDAAADIDWRRSARGDQYFVRENEWEAANSVFFWRDGNAGMDWTSSSKLPTKKDRASIISMALAILLMRSGERCSVLGESERPRSGRVGIERITQRLAESAGPLEHLNAKMPAYAHLIITSDFLEDPDVWKERLTRFAARPVKAILLRLIDPAEEQFPYKGRMEMRLPGNLNFPPLIVGRAERAKASYQNHFKAHGEALDNMARRLGWPLVKHYTDQPANLAVTALYQSIGGEI